MRTWDDRAPIYQQLAEQLAARLLDGEYAEGQALPSVRTLAGLYMINPLTVSRALQALDEDGLLDNRRGLGFFVRPGARERLRSVASQRFLQHEWPPLRARLKRLGLGADDLNWDKP